MGATVKFEAVLTAIGRELMGRIEALQADTAATLERKAACTDTAEYLIKAVVDKPGIGDHEKNLFANLVYEFNLHLISTADAKVQDNEVAIAALEQQIADAGSITPEALDTDKEGNVDFDHAIEAIITGLERDKQTLVGGAEQALADAREKSETLDALIVMARGFTPERP